MDQPQPAAVGSIHFLIRPHLFTFGFVYLTLRACQRQHERGGRAVFAVSDHVVVLDRLKELVKVDGYQVAPAELEELLLTHPCVADAAVTPDLRA